MGTADASTCLSALPAPLTAGNLEPREQLKGTTKKEHPVNSRCKLVASVGPARLLQSSLAFLLCSVELHELGQGQTRLELDPIHGHGDHHWYLCIGLGPEGRLTEFATSSKDHLIIVCHYTTPPNGKYETDDSTPSTFIMNHALL